MNWDQCRVCGHCIYSCFNEHGARHAELLLQDAEKLIKETWGPRYHPASTYKGQLTPAIPEIATSEVKELFRRIGIPFRRRERKWEGYSWRKDPFLVLLIALAGVPFGVVALSFGAALWTG